MARQEDQSNNDSTLLFINTYSGSITIPSHFSQTPPSAQAPPYAQAPPSYLSVTRPASDRLKNQFNNVSTRGSRNDSAAQYGRAPPSYSSVWNTESPWNTSARRPPSYTSMCQFNNRMTNDTGNTPTYGRPPSFYDSLWGTEYSGDIQLNDAVNSLSHSSVFSSLPTYSRYTGDSTMADHLQY